MGGVEEIFFFGLFNPFLNAEINLILFDYEQRRSLILLLHSHRTPHLLLDSSLVCEVNVNKRAMHADDVRVF